MIVVTTPTGKIGSQVIPHLLAAGEAVRVVARYPARLAPEVRNRVQVVTGSLDDEAVMRQALEGAESVFLVVPPSFTDNNDTEYYLRFTLPTLAAMKSQGVKRIVDVSVLGRGTDLAKKTGSITASLAKDEEIERSGVDYRALWCPALMENMLNNVQTIKQQGMFFSPSHPDLKTPQVATKDIGAMGARFLLDRTWTGQGGCAVLGPQGLSFNDMAAIMSGVLGKHVRFQQVPRDAYKAQLIQHGANEVFAQGLLDMLVAKDNGMDNVEARMPENRTPTSFHRWCGEVLKPAALG
ncbi:uncharacterized protein YbjT (DUF2867 family) [Granulicella aggregans]|uniref:Uncharacterized protein YbjT (DUF2867 family) n=1 Tax=Granulicella aggregans TaxID=474949 RepID=A0A7W8E582_9BACT|nr:NmrA family NAD(P)-binding protein [Granulicella aggregans]MBB5059356.1 uncharacterized protein YbjT (DUF2867 family) [Granulicella aggregans]